MADMPLHFATLFAVPVPVTVPVQLVVEEDIVSVSVEFLVTVMLLPPATVKVSLLLSLQ